MDKAAYMREYNQRNFDRINAQRRERYAKNREKVLSQQKSRLDDSPELREAKRQRDRAYRLANKDKISAKRRIDRVLNPDKYRRWELTRKLKTGRAKSKYSHRLRWIAKNKDKERAHASVYRALKSGKITKPDRCEKCCERSPLHGHHYLGYADEHRLDVIWLCDSCHKLAHLKT